MHSIFKIILEIFHIILLSLSLGSSGQHVSIGALNFPWEYLTGIYISQQLQPKEQLPIPTWFLSCLDTLKFLTIIESSVSF